MQPEEMEVYRGPTNGENDPSRPVRVFLGRLIM
jgi:hypothetical protein